MQRASRSCALLRTPAVVEVTAPRGQNESHLPACGQR
jgi:hypothetical protein